MVNYYLFLHWGIYIYYGLKIITAFAILSAAKRSLLLPLAALIVALLALFTNTLYINTLVSSDTAWQLGVVAFVGILTTIFVRQRI